MPILSSNASPVRRGQPHRWDWVSKSVYSGHHGLYIMRAYDGAQFVYWEADDPSEVPIDTLPPAQGELTAVRIFHEF